MLYFIIAIVLGSIIFFAVRNNGGNASRSNDASTTNDGVMYVGDAGVHDTSNGDTDNDWESGNDNSNDGGSSDTGGDGGGGDGGGGGE